MNKNTFKLFMKIKLWLVTLASLMISYFAWLFAFRVVTPLKKAAEPLTVIEISNSPSGKRCVVLTRGEDSELRGKYLFVFDDENGYARLGEVISQDEKTVTRELLDELQGSLSAGTTGRITGWWYAEPAESYAATSVMVAGMDGSFSGWLIPAKSKNLAPGTLVIHVHGRGAKKAETLRGAQILSETGFDNLVISYRNDRGEPRSRDGKYGLGYFEAEDIASSIDWATLQGYDKVVLFGWSMGGAASLIYHSLNPTDDRLEAIILESPAVDWNEILERQAVIANLPAKISKISTWLIEHTPWILGLRKGIPLSKLNARFYARALRVKTLLIVSSKDTFVPFDAALELAKKRADLVTLFRTEFGEHVKSWNEDAEIWEHAVTDFMLKNVSAKPSNV